MGDVEAVSKTLRDLLNEFERRLAGFAVALVISERDRTRLRDDYRSFSVSASFLHTWEISVVVEALRSWGMYVHHFNDELDFIAWAIDGGFEAMPRSHALVYTSAINGTGPGRRTLVPAFCALRQLPTLNSDAYACAINRHKFHWSVLLQAFGLPVARCWFFDHASGWLRGDGPPPSVKVVGKATYEGSSIGLNDDTVGVFDSDLEKRFARRSEELRQPLTVQEYIAGREFEVPVIETATGHSAPVAVRIRRRGVDAVDEPVFQYGKVFDDDYHFDIEPDSSATRAMRSVAVDVARTLDFRGVSRVDFRAGSDGPKIIDVSGTPHLTHRTSVAAAFAAMRFSYEEMWAVIVALGARRHRMA